MSKKTRGFQPPAGNASEASEQWPNETETGGASGTPGASGAPGTRASARRRTVAAARPTPSQGILERYRSVLLIGFTALGIGIVMLFFFASASGGDYKCLSLLTPGPTEPIPTPRLDTPSPSPSATVEPSASPTDAASSPGATSAASPTPSTAPTPSPSPEPQPTQRLGFPTKDLGAKHEDIRTTISYGFCPPTSGNHFFVTGQAPLTRQFYPPSTSLRPGNWIHNLEHGFVLILYRGDPGQATLDDIKRVMDSVAPSAIAVSCGLLNHVIAARFDDMNTPYALVAWNRALLLDAWDPVAAATFAQQWQDSPQHPEPAC